MNYEYAFVTVPAQLGGPRGASPAYQAAIAEHAAQGWRFVQLVVENTAAVPAEYTLIFERPVTTEADLPTRE